MAMPTTLDGAAVRRLFDTTTFARGWSYVTSGAVLDYSYDPAGDVVAGDVQGRGAYPYEVVVRMTRSATGVPTRVDGECSCPVSRNCKHVAALLLASGTASGKREPTGNGTAGQTTKIVRAKPGGSTSVGDQRRKAARWEKPLLEVVEGLVDTAAAAATEPELALQFELVTNRRNARKQGTTPGIEVRPVLRSPSGNWVRTGTSWSKFEYSYAQTGLAAERQRLLRELLVVSRLSSGLNGYGYSSYGSDAPLWLEDISSRRLWDLLGHAAELHIRLVSSGKGGAIRLLPAPAVVGADLIADGQDLRMSPCIEAGGERVPLGSSLLIGSTPHGLAWWREGQGPKGALQLTMAPFPDR